MRISINNLSFSYHGHKVLNNISFSADSGTLLWVLGPNGAGKSTMFKCILQLMTNYDGAITINGSDLKKIPYKILAGMVSYVPQFHNTVFNYTVKEIVLMGCTAQLPAFSQPGAKEMLHVGEIMERLGIKSFINRRFCEISGGEKQLVLIARALAQNARIIIMDEPTSNLDYGNRIRVMSVIKKLTQTGYLVIQSAHDPEQTFLYADQVIILRNGEMMSKGTPQEMITSTRMKDLYGVDVSVDSIQNDKIRICMPVELMRQSKK